MDLVSSYGHSLKALFSDGEDSSFCACCMLGATAKGLFMGRRITERKSFSPNLSQDLSLWTAQMRFLFTPRTEEQTRQLLERLDRCSCKMNDPKIREYHQYGRFAEVGITFRVGEEIQSKSIAYIMTLFSILGSALEGTHFKSVARGTGAATKRWPTCPEDLMPFGPQNLIDSIIVWSRILPDSGVIFTVATQCIQFCGSLLIPYVVESSLTHHVIDCARRLFDRTWSTVRLRAETRRRGMGEAFVHQAAPFLDYFRLFFDKQLADQKVAMLDGYELKMLQVCSLLAYIADDPRLFLKKSEAFRCAMVMRAFETYRCIMTYVNPVPSILLHPDICKLRLQTSNFQILNGTIDEVSKLQTSITQGEELSLSENERFLELKLYGPFARLAITFIRSLRFGLHCSAPDCPHTLQSAGRSFQRCSGCNVASYCSKKCQTDAWHTGTYPHKTLCKILRSVVPIVGSEVLFRCEQGRDRAYYPDELAELVTEKWCQEKVPISDIFKMVGWASYRRCQPVLMIQRECDELQDGYPDYEDILAELERDGAPKAEYFDPTALTPDMNPENEYTAYRYLFENNFDLSEMARNEMNRRALQRQELLSIEG
ncbi:hypothetical protein BDN70DRAFT_887284 [Pholiota conissans]|uniref:MYND-type domain-containing protein n=1 Tax=Pholiota conissans TaxID=109636 RepID=A0A9P5YLT8_9AGAR|nr:hypothetical protein BDN70DRAFT_887284 [Pholiota conissans]